MPLIEVVDESIFVWEALRHSPVASDRKWALGVRTRSWIEFSAARAAAADLVVISADLIDHVPAVLKARAVTALGTRVGFLINPSSSAAVDRLMLEGATFVARRDATSWHQLLSEICAALQDPPPTEPAALPRGLTDRELQIAALFASRAAPTTQQIARLLALSVGTVRTHLKRARHRLSVTGMRVSSREELRSALLAEGYLVEGF